MSDFVSAWIVYGVGVVVFGMWAAYRLGTHSDTERQIMFTTLGLLVVLWPVWIFSLPFYFMFALGDHVRAKRLTKEYKDA